MKMGAAGQKEASKVIMQTQKMSAQCFSKYNLQKIQKLQERSTNKMDDDVFALQRKKTHHFCIWQKAQSNEI